MARQVFRTVNEIEMALADEVSARLNIRIACQQLIEALYAHGKLRGTTKEIEVGTSSVFVADGDDAYMVKIAAEDYDAALAFRTDTAGFSVADLASLYKDPPTAWDTFIDRGYDDAEEYRRYRVPTCLHGTGETIFALMKKRAPLLTPDDKVPVDSLHAVKLGLLAVGYESEGEVKVAEAFWEKFYGEMAGDAREFDGIKRRHVSFNSGLKRRPTNRP